MHGHKFGRLLCEAVEVSSCQLCDLLLVPVGYPVLSVPVLQVDQLLPGTGPSSGPIKRRPV